MFKVIDLATREPADIFAIISRGQWEPLFPPRGPRTDVVGFVLLEDGRLCVLNEVGNCIVCNPGRFRVEFKQEDGDVPETEIPF